MSGTLADMRATLPATLGALLLLTACATNVQRQEASAPDDNDILVTDRLPAGSFARDEDGFSGDLFVRGFPIIARREEAFCMEQCETVEYVYFRIMETGNAALSDFLHQYAGNAYVQRNAVGLGCKENGALRFSHISEAQGMRDDRIGGEQATDILEANDDGPVTLHLTKEPFSGGSEAPPCFSHFNAIRVRKSVNEPERS